MRTLQVRSSVGLHRVRYNLWKKKTPKKRKHISKPRYTFRLLCTYPCAMLLRRRSRWYNTQLYSIILYSAVRTFDRYVRTWFDPSLAFGHAHENRTEKTDGKCFTYGIFFNFFFHTYFYDILCLRCGYEPAGNAKRLGTCTSTIYAVD